MANSEMKLHIKMSRPEILNVAIRLAVELETYFKTKKLVDLRIIDSDEGAQPRTTKLMVLLKTKLDELKTRLKLKHDKDNLHRLQLKTYAIA